MLRYHMVATGDQSVKSKIHTVTARYHLVIRLGRSVVSRNRLAILYDHLVTCTDHTVIRLQNVYIGDALLRFTTKKHTYTGHYKNLTLF